MTQYSRPAEDITTGFWYRVGGSYNYACINEVDYYDDTYIYTMGSAQTYEVKLSAVTDPISSVNHIVRFRARANGSSTTENLTVTLRQDAFTVIATIYSGAITRGSFNEYSYTLTTAQANAITDYSNLRLRFVSGTLAGGEALDVSWAVLEVPDTPGRPVIRTANFTIYSLPATTVNNSIHCYLDGSPVGIPASTSQQSYLSGVDIGVASSPSFAIGLDSIVTSTSVYLSGALNTTNAVSGYLCGSDTSKASGSAYISGNESVTSSTNGYIYGYRPGILPSLVPTSFDSYEGKAWESTDATLIDEGVDNYDGQYIEFISAEGDDGGSIYFNLTDMPQDFYRMKDLAVKIRYKTDSYAGNDAVNLQIHLHKSTNKTTEIGASVTPFNTSTPIGWTTYTYNGVSSNSPLTKEEWNSALVELKIFHINIGESSLPYVDIDAIEFTGTYYILGKTSTPVYMFGTTSSKTSQPVFLKGKNDVTSRIPAYTKFGVITTDSLHSYICGNVSTSSSVHAFIASQANAKNERYTIFVRPNQDINNSGWSSSTNSPVLYEDVNDIGPHDGDESYIDGWYGSCISFGMEDIEPACVIPQVKVHIVAKMESGINPSDFSFWLTQSGTEDFTHTISVTEEWQEFVEVYNLSVDGVTPWTPEILNGIGIALYAIPYEAHFFITQVWFEIPGEILRGYLKGSSDVKSQLNIYVNGNVNDKTSLAVYTTGIVRSSIHAYISGGISEIGTRPGYLIGQDIFKDNLDVFLCSADTGLESTPAYLIGSASNLSVQNAFLQGSVDTNSSAHAFTKFGIVTTDVKTTYLTGSNTESSRVSAYVNSFAPNASGVVAFIVGQDSITTNQYAYTIGDIRVSQSAYISGGEVTGETQNSYLSGTDTQVAQTPGYLCGSSTETAIAHSYILGSFQTQIGIPAFSTGGENPVANIYSFLSGIDTTSSIASAYLAGQPGNMFNALPAYLAGIDTSLSQKSALVWGKSGAVFSTFAYALGSTNTSSQTPAFITPNANIVNSLSAYLIGYTANQSVLFAFASGKNTLTTNQKSYVLGGIIDLLHSYTRGSVTVTSNINGYLTGISSDTSAQSGFVVGQDYQADRVHAFLRSIANAIDSRTVYIEGKSGTPTTKIPAYLRGASTIWENQSGFSHGQIAITSYHNSFVYGLSSTLSIVYGYTKGKNSLTGQTSAYLVGSSNVVVALSAYLSGEASTTSTNAFLAGSLNTDSSTSGYLYGSVQFYGNISAYTEGFGIVRSAEAAFIDGKFGDQAWLATPAYLNGIAVDYELLGTFIVKHALLGEFITRNDVNGEFVIQNDLNGCFSTEYVLEGLAKVLYNLLGKSKSP